MMMQQLIKRKLQFKYVTIYTEFLYFLCIISICFDSYGYKQAHDSNVCKVFVYP